MKKKSLIYVFNVLFIALIGVLTFRLVFKDRAFGQILDDLDKANKLWLLAGAALAILFVAGEAVIIRYMLGLFREKIPLRRCLKYSFIGFFYSYITPSASGGQPAQMYYMKKDGIKLGHSSLTMLVITVTFKAVLIVFGAVFLLIGRDFVIENTGDYFWLIIVGFGLNLAYTAGLLMLLLKPKSACKLINSIVRLLCRIGLIGPEKRQRCFKRVIRLERTYKEGAEYIRTHFGTVAKVFAMTCVQRLFFFAVTWVVYKSYGLSGTSFFGIITMQTMIAISVEMLPLPGAAGITEACFMVMFGGIFGEELVRSGMLLSRGLTFYVILFAGAAVTLGAHIIAVKKQRSSEEKEKRSARQEMAA